MLRLESGTLAASVDLDDLDYVDGVLVGKVIFVFDDAPYVTAHYFDDDFQQSLVDFEGEDEALCKYCEAHSDAFAKEIERLLTDQRNYADVIATQADVKREADRCWAV